MVSNPLGLNFNESYQNKIDSLLRSQTLYIKKPEDYVGSPVKHIINPPFKPIDIYVKQICWESLTYIGRVALDAAFSGYAEPLKEKDYPDYVDKKIIDAFATDSLADSKRMARRFAGDQTLPRGAYYSLCDESGDDKGTLVGELRAYYSPERSGVVQMFDCTLPNDLSIVRNQGKPIANPQQLIFNFLPNGGLNNPFIEKIADIIPISSEFVIAVIGLPLSIKKISRNKVLDLRDPEMAEWFVKALSSLTWQLEEDEEHQPCFPLRGSLKKIEDLLPEMLDQEIGGGGVCRAAGLMLRYLGADGLIFPSARNDSSVSMVDGNVVSSDGWNFLDYLNAPPPELLCLVENGKLWPNQIGFRPPFAANDDAEPYWLPEVTINIDEKGSWQVEGLRDRTNLTWRIDLAQCSLLTYRDCLSKEAFSLLFILPVLLKDGGAIDLAGWTAKYLFDAVMGDHDAGKILYKLYDYLTPDFDNGFLKVIDEFNEKVVLPERKKFREIYLIWQGEDFDNEGKVGFEPTLNR